MSYVKGSPSVARELAHRMRVCARQIDEKLDDMEQICKYLHRVCEEADLSEIDAFSRSFEREMSDAASMIWKVSDILEAYGMLLYGLSAKQPEANSHLTFNMRAAVADITSRVPEQSRAYYNQALKAGKHNRVRLVGKGEEFYISSTSTEQRSSGNYLAPDYPGNTPQERRENYQLPKGNEANVVEKVRTTRAQLVIESTVAPQETFAAEGGYTAREGNKQIYIPNTNKKGAIGDHRVEVLQEGTGKK